MSNTAFKSAKSLKDAISLLDPSPEVRSLREKVTEQNTKINHLKIQLGQNREFFSEISNAITEIKPKEMAYRITKKSKVESPLSCVLLLCDWHTGCVIEHDAVEGFNDFNWGIQRDRVQYLGEKFSGWVDLHKNVYSIQELVILAVGDMISGDIHDELKVTNEFPVPVQIVNAGTLFAELVASLAPQFPSVRVEYLVPDNHSRLTKKVQFKQTGLNSYNYLVGWIAQERLRAHKNVEFNLITSIKEVVTVQRMRYLLVHGNGIKGWSGFPYYGIDRQASREAIARMKKPISTHFDKVVLGHFHAPLRHPKWTIGGSLSGTDELDHSEGREADPCQVAWLVHPKHGEFNWVEFRLLS